MVCWFGAWAFNQSLHHSHSLFQFHYTPAIRLFVFDFRVERKIVLSVVVKLLPFNYVALCIMQQNSKMLFPLPFCRAIFRWCSIYIIHTHTLILQSHRLCFRTLCARCNGLFGRCLFSCRFYSFISTTFDSKSFDFYEIYQFKIQKSDPIAYRSKCTLCIDFAFDSSFFQKFFFCYSSLRFHFSWFRTDWISHSCETCYFCAKFRFFSSTSIRHVHVQVNAKTKWSFRFSFKVITWIIFVPFQGFFPCSYCFENDFNNSNNWVAFALAII